MNDKRKKVIFIVKQLSHGGVQRVLYDVVAGLDKKVFDCTILTFYPDKHACVPTGVKTISLDNSIDGNSSVWKALITIWNLRRTIDGIDSSAVLVPFLARPTTAYVVISQIGRKRKIIGSYHTAERPYMEFNYKTRAKRFVESLMLKLATRGCEKVVVHSIGIQNDLIHYYSATDDKITIIPNPVDLRRIALSSREIVSVPCDISGKIIFCCIGRISPEKNHELLIAAVKRLQTKLENFLIIIAGGGGRYKVIECLIHQEQVDKVVKMVGVLDNPFSLMAASRALVLTSHYDAYPMVLKEAMACGTPVISVDCPYGPMDILGGGQYGMLVPPDNPDSLAEAMYKMAVDECMAKKYALRGLSRAREHSYSDIIKQWDKVLLS